MTAARPRRLEYLPLDDVEGAPRNPKGHDDAGIDASLAEFGYVEAITMDERTGRLVAGHGRLNRLRAMRDAGEDPPDGIIVGRGGVWRLPVQRGWSSRDDAQAEAYLIASNRLTEAGGWSSPIELGEMLTELRESEFPLDAVGFSSDQIDELLASLEAPEPETPDEPADELAPPTDPVTRRGDVWTLGRHRVMCGDCRDADDVATLLDGAVVNLAVTSPPYADRRDYDATSGFEPIKPDDYVEWFAPVAANVAAHLADDGSWLVNIKAGADGLDRDLYVIDLVAAHVRQWGWHFAEEFCWERIGVPKQPVLRLKGQFEPVYQFTRDRWKFRPDHVSFESEDAIIAFGPGRGNTSWADPDSAVVSQGQRGDMFEGQRAGKRVGRGDTSWKGKQGQPGGAIPKDTTTPRKRKNGRRGAGATNEAQGSGVNDVGEFKATGKAYPGNRLPSFIGTHEATGHTAAYPVGLPAWFTRLFTDEGDVVFDPFCGSGSTILAAHGENRVGYGMELSPAYVDIICARFERHTGIVPVRANEPVSFA